MITSEECRRHLAYCREEAKFEDDLGTRTALLALSRSWVTIADQIDWFEALCDPKNSRHALPQRADRQMAPRARSNVIPSP
jgi:hypothetical protein